MTDADRFDILEQLALLDDVRRQLDEDSQGSSGRLIRGPVMRGLARMNRASDLAFLRRLAELQTDTHPDCPSSAEPADTATGADRTCEGTSR